VNAVAAMFFDGRSSRPHSVQLGALGGVLTIRAGDWERREAMASVRITPRVAGIHRTLLLPDGGQVQVQDNDAVDAWFPDHHRTAALIDRLERHPLAVAASLLITVVGLAFVIFFGIPLAAEKVAMHIPPAVAREMGEQTVTMLGRFGFDDSKLPQKRRDELQAVFRKYVADLPDPSHYELHFMSAKMPNAFALPGDIIVITDGMVDVIASKNAGTPSAAATDSDDDDSADDEDDDSGSDSDSSDETSDGKSAGANEGTDAAGKDGAKSDNKAEAAKPSDPAANERFLAVIAHEIGHEEHRHVLRSVLQSSGVVLLGAYFTGDVSSASALVISVPTFLLDSHYSRDFEAEADTYAFDSLAKHGISPGRFAEVMNAMQSAYPRFSRQESGYLSTHPPTVERIMKAREAAERSKGY
jgi:Zn-dependent protease with chaperone function